MAFGGPGKLGGRLYRPIADINVTPLVDVMLVLLIIFMITAPLFSAGLKVNLPQAKTVVPLDPKEPIILTIQKDGRLALGPDEVDPNDLIPAIQAKLGGDNERLIHLRSDKEVPFGDVVSVMDRLATNGLTHLAIVARPWKKGEQADPATPAKPSVPLATGIAPAPDAAPRQ